MAKQVQLRGGSSEEHREFTGASREITIDTTINTIRVHDGVTKGGHIICTRGEMINETDRIKARIDNIQTNMSESHNHDNRYVSNYDAYVHNTLGVGNIRLSGRDVIINNQRALVGHGNDGGNKLIINYDGDFVGGTEIKGTVYTHDFLCKGRRPFLDEHINGYYGLCTPDANNWDWIRTTQNGIIPFQSGGYSNIGTSSWRFNEGWFNHVNAHTLNLSKNGSTSRINFSASVNDPGFLEHVENNNTSRMVFSVSDDFVDNDQFWFGASQGVEYRCGAVLTADGKLWLNRHIETAAGIMVMGGRYIYFDGQRPWDAPEGSISFG